MDYVIRKPPRGLKRRTRLMIERIEEYTVSFPEEDFEGSGYWHLHLPVAQDFIDSVNTPRSIRRLCIQTLINGTQHLIDIKPEAKSFARVVALIDLPKLWDSQIVVFFDPKYFNGFFDRDSEDQRWTPLPEKRDIAKEWHLAILDNLKIKGYLEEIHEEDYDHIGEIWAIGELD